MADGIAVTFDVSSVLSQLDKLSDKSESLGRRMAVAGGQVIRDEAKKRAEKSSPPYNPISGGSQEPGTLQDAIYLSRSERITTATQVGYTISWSNTHAWWGKLKEFGWWQTHKIAYVPGHDYFITTDELLDAPIRHAAEPFLAPAYEAKIGEVRQVMITTGREELPKLLGEPT